MSFDSSRYRALPPLKRFTLLHHCSQHNQDPHPRDRPSDKENADPRSAPLPAKKRKESRSPISDTPLSDRNVAAAYCLPTKKRVWALRPDFEPCLSPIDLNAEYKPSFCEQDGVGRSVQEASDDLDKLPSVFSGEGERRNWDAEIEKKKEDKQNDLFPIPDLKAQVRTAEEEDVPTLEPEEKSPERENTEREEENPDEEEDGILCAICQSTDGDPADPIVFCDGCNLMTHATCYGSPLIHGIPDGEWYCHRCLTCKNDPVIACCLCPNTGGAMKQTMDGRWAHIVCSVFVPEVFFEDAEGREGINCGGIGGKKLGGKCYICGGRSGCTVECAERRCGKGFHVTCGLEEDLWMDYREGRGKGIVAGFCKEHTELWKKQQETGKFKIVAREEKP